jgi:hypothetical protein
MTSTLSQEKNHYTFIFFKAAVEPQEKKEKEKARRNAGPSLTPVNFLSTGDAESPRV